MKLQIKIFLNQFENNSWFETLGRYIDLENTEFDLEVEVDVKDYFMTMDFNYNEITLHGTEINVPRHLQHIIIDNWYAELIKQYNDEKNGYESDKYDACRDNNL
jgi:hypothetical protein